MFSPRPRLSWAPNGPPTGPPTWWWWWWWWWRGQSEADRRMYVWRDREPSICVYWYLYIDIYICPSVYPSISICLSIYIGLSFCLTVALSACSPICPPVHPSVRPSVFVSLWLLDKSCLSSWFWQNPKNQFSIGPEKEETDEGNSVDEFIMLPKRILFLLWNKFHRYRKWKMWIIQINIK